MSSTPTTGIVEVSASDLTAIADRLVGQVRPGEQIEVIAMGEDFAILKREGGVNLVTYLAARLRKRAT